MCTAQTFQIGDQNDWYLMTNIMIMLCKSTFAKIGTEWGVPGFRFRLF